HSQPGHKPPGFVVQGAAHVPNGGADQLAPPWNDPTRTARLARLDVESQPVGQHVAVEGRNVYALTVPIHDPERRTIAAIELVRAETDAERALAESQKAAVAAVAGLGLMLAVLVWASTRSTISSPLKRLVEAIDDVTHGDLGRVILRERDDEVGDLA